MQEVFISPAYVHIVLMVICKPQVLCGAVLFVHTLIKCCNNFHNFNRLRQSLHDFGGSCVYVHEKHDVSSLVPLQEPKLSMYVGHE